MGVGADTPHLSTKLNPESVRTFSFDRWFLVNSPLVTLDSQGAPRPLLAANIPSRERGTWTVHPDNTMATTWRINPHAVWHDGRSVTSGDFLFALRVYLDPELEVFQRELELLIDRIELVDDTTFVAHWKQIYLRGLGRSPARFNGPTAGPTQPK
jgi:ABC-type transport system substrate-binding protein